jgi:predicted nucleic acid-binding protein
MDGRLTFLVDTNVWLELLLEQERANEVRRFLEAAESRSLSVSDFTVHSIGVVMTRLKEEAAFKQFLSDTVEDSGMKSIRLDIPDLMRAADICRGLHLDFDDAYQYIAASKHDLRIVSFDTDFDRTPLGRVEPGKALNKRL